MAKTIVAPALIGYQYISEAFPLSTITSDQCILSLAGRLHRQAIRMDKAYMAERHFDYKPIPIPHRLIHIFGA